MNHENGLYFHDRDSLANAINVPAYYDLSAELIADTIFNNKENTHQVSAAQADIISERQRQIAGGFFTHGCGEGQLVSAAIAYINLAFIWKNKDPADYRNSIAPSKWMLPPELWKPENPRRDLIKGVAMLIAERERRDRKEAAQ
ncbi:hypothetical protein L4A43_23725 [Salmonella enterica subsp. diarizonae serovar 16:z10:e,n,x,z15]|uniref:hypothetical protein n=1 Tax=Salmonella enterica TaxID=28901 RepID=UPI001F0EF317|nr:hypothetical protein [Salmonella enterica subsp. diarizonae serovar 16:z10:e,n,x,z15]